MKVGDYVRTKDDLGIQLICKIKKIIDEYCIDTDRGYWDNEHIIKSSTNIIDLIEVGDYVNGVLINIKDNKGVYHGAYDSADEVHITKIEDIKSIVTYEQFESMKYKVGK